MSEIDLDCIGAIHRREDSILCPFRIVMQDPLCEDGRLFHPDTAVAEVTARPREQLRRGGPVHIDIVRIREDKFDQSQGILRPGLLSDPVRARTKTPENLIRNRAVRNHLAGTVRKYVVICRHVVGVAPNLRN